MWWVVLTSLVTSAAQETAMETTQPWLSAPSQQPSCLCPTVQVWKISTLVIICFTWQNLLLQLMTQMHYCQKDCCLVRYRHYKGIQLHLAFLQGFPCIEGSWGFLWTIWYLLYCAHTSPACELTYNLCLEFVACCWHKTISALDNGLYQVNKENISHFVNINKESQEPLWGPSDGCDGVDVKCSGVQRCSQMQSAMDRFDTLRLSLAFVLRDCY